MLQRLIDLSICLVAIIILSPLLVFTIIILKLTGEGEVFFVQERVGRNRHKFRLYKFATMLKDSPNLGAGTITLKGDPRILPVGNILRATKFNELPQLFNVLMGDMSLVGPRPQEERCFAAYSPRIQERITTVRPGLSGVGSVIFRGEDQLLNSGGNASDFYDTVIMPYKGQLEEWYVLHKSFFLYVKCLVATVWVVLFPKSSACWALFEGIPAPPEELKTSLGFVMPADR